MKSVKILAAAAFAALVSTSASAAPIVLDFEGITAHNSGNSTTIDEFYNGGTSSAGTSGTDYGISFSNNSLNICLNTLTVTCSNTSRGGLGDPDSQLGGLFFLSGNASIMNVAAGFDTGFSFFYSASNNAGSVSVWDDLGGTGNLLASLNLTTTSGSCPDYNAGFCPFAAEGIGFTGIAKSVSFAGVANQIVFDDITFGSITPNPDTTPSPVPLPAGLSLLVGGLAALRVLKRRG